jgi:hypothetical protein
MKYQTLIPITHNGQDLPVGLVFSDSDAFGKKEKSPLEIDRLLAKKRIAPVAVAASEPPKGDPGSQKDEEKGKK